jgi:hypothetical protein
MQSDGDIDGDIYGGGAGTTGSKKGMNLKQAIRQAFFVCVC